MVIGKRLREIRKNRGMTLPQLAKLSKVSKAYISQLENGQFSNPSSEIVIKLCSVLGISVDFILGLESIPIILPKRSDGLLHLRTLAKEENLSDEDIEMLSGITYNGRQPNSIEGWRAVIKAIQKSTNNEKL